MNFIRVKSIDELLTHLRTAPKNYGLIAGGTDIMAGLKKGIEKRVDFIDLSPLKEVLSGITEGKEVITIGAMTTFEAIQKSQLLQNYFPALVETAKTIGGFTIQCMGTIGGNIANASPAADSVPPLLVLDAVVVLRNIDRERRIPLKDFYKGYKDLEMAQDEIITSIELPKKNLPQKMVEVGSRRAVFISKVSLAIAQKGDHYQLAAGSVYAYPVRLFETEKIFHQEQCTREAFVKTLQKDVSPLPDVRSSAEYRFKVLTNLVYDAYLNRL